MLIRTLAYTLCRIALAISCPVLMLIAADPNTFLPSLASRLIVGGIGAFGLLIAVRPIPD